jgi:rod shape-determining protein MreD
MKRILTIGFISLILLIMDNSIMPFFAIYGYTPSLLFIYIISISIIYGKWEGLWFGVFAGLLQDVFFGVGFGINSLTNMLMCATAGEIGVNIIKKKTLIPAFTCFVLSLVKGLMVFIILYIFGSHMSLVAVLFSSIYNLVLCLIMYRLIYKFSKKPFMQKEWRF